MIDTSNKEIQSHYDFIVVGAGAAGSVLAAELSASGSQVLVIESGGSDDAPTIMNPSIWFYNVAGRSLKVREASPIGSGTLRECPGAHRSSCFRNSLVRPLAR